MNERFERPTDDAIEQANAGSTATRPCGGVPGESATRLSGAVLPTGHSAGRIQTVRCRVLVVEDLEDCLTTMIDLLSMEGYEVRGARDSAAALELVASWHPSIIFMDLGLPVFDGCETAKRIRAIHLPRQPRIVAVSGWAPSHIQEKAQNCGIDSFLSKPVSWELLAQSLREAGEWSPSAQARRSSGGEAPAAS